MNFSALLGEMKKTISETDYAISSHGMILTENLQFDTCPEVQ
jgi:hypothetical protein